MDLITPSGFRDVLSDEAIEREQIQRRVQDLFAEHGFMPIETPTLEVMDVMQAGGKLPNSPFKFFDSQGDLLAMRPDVTLQVARMYATRIPTVGTPQRYRYTQRVFRETEGDAQVLPREITQIGVECIDQTGAAVDGELIQLMVEAIGIAGVADICIALATVGPLRALLERSGASDAWKRAILASYHDSDFVELDRLTSLDPDLDVDTSGVAPAYAQAIRALARVRGGREAIDAARELVMPLGCDAGLEELELIYDALTGNDAAVRILVDFSVMSSFDYYTGVVFVAYSPYLGTPLGSGGRYDKMISAFGKDAPAAGFAFSLEQAIAANAAEAELIGHTEEEILDEEKHEIIEAALGKRTAHPKVILQERPLRIAVPKGALNAQAVECLEAAGLDVEGLHDIGRHLVIRTPEVEYIIVRPSDAPAFVAFGAVDCGICGRDSLLESGAQVVELVDLAFGGCRFVVAQPEGATPQIEERYRRLGSIRIATKYPHITLAHFAKTGVQVDIVKLHGNIELAPLTGMAERIVDITATGTTLRQNHLEIVEEVLDSTARFFANPCSLRTDERVVELARKLAEVSRGAEFAPIAGKAM